MKQKKWTSKKKLRIVLEGIKGQVPLGELCARNGVSQAQYYKWRDRLLKEGEKAFEYGGVTANEERLRQENLRLMLQTTKGLAVQNPIPVSLIDWPDITGWLIPIPSSGILTQRSIRT